MDRAALQRRACGAVAARSALSYGLEANGLGIAYHFEVDQVGELLKQGRLVQILSDWTISRPGIFLYYSNRQHRPALLGSFIDCMLDREPFSDA